MRCIRLEHSVRRLKKQPAVTRRSLEKQRIVSHHQHERVDRLLLSLFRPSDPVEKSSDVKDAQS